MRVVVAMLPTMGKQLGVNKKRKALKESTHPFGTTWTTLAIAPLLMSFVL